MGAPGWLIDRRGKRRAALLLSFVALAALYQLHGLGLFGLILGFALLETGRISGRRFDETLARYLFAAALASAAYVLAGFGLMYDTSPGESLPGLVAGHGMISPWQDLVMQAQCCASGALVLSGIVARAMHGWSHAVISVLFGAVIYPVFGRWTWGGGWLNAMGFHDYAGGTIVYGIACWTGMAFLVMHVTRPGMPAGSDPAAMGSSANYAAGALLLWMTLAGWSMVDFLVFNTFPRIYTEPFLAAVNTNLAFISGGLGAGMLGGVLKLRPWRSLLWPGALSGIAAITANLEIFPGYAAVVSFLAGLLAAAAMWGFRRLRFPDELEFIAAFGVGGAWGTFAAGEFSTATLLPQLAGLVQAGMWAGAWGAGLGLLLGWLERGKAPGRRE